MPDFGDSCLRRNDITPVQAGAVEPGFGDGSPER